MSAVKRKTFCHLIYIPFRGVGIADAYHGDDWYSDRIEIFKNYTLKSLLNQSDPNFVLWISFRPQDISHPLTAELANYLKHIGIEYILTFDGLMYFDDKHDTRFLGRIMNYGRIVRGAWRNRTFRDIISAIWELYQNKNRTLASRVQRSVDIIGKHFREVDWVYVTRIDSDDMFHKDLVHEIQQQPTFEGAYVLRNGYIHNKDTGEVSEYKPDQNPPFHTIIFPVAKFFDADKYMAQFKGFRSHEDIPKVFPSIRLRDGMYCVLTHNPKMHVSTIWNHPFRKDLVVNPQEVMRDFGIEICKN